MTLGQKKHLNPLYGVVICERKKNVSSKGDILLPATWAGRHAGTLAHAAGGKMSPLEERFFLRSQITTP